MSSTARAEDSILLALASSIARGEPVAWDGASTTTTPPHLVDALRAIDAVAQLARRIPDTWGRASISGELGHGAHGVVYAAHDPHLGIDLALKVVRPRGPDRQTSVTTAQREAQLLAQVSHPNVVRVFWAEAIGAEIGVAMERVQGYTLTDLLKQRGPLGAREAMEIGVDLCRALGAVHARNLLHGDIKASNVMRAAGRTVLMDFGVGQDLKIDDSTGLGRVGTPLYLAPELFSGGARSPQSDIYSTGVLLFQLVTNSFPIDARDASAVEQHHGARRPLRRLRDLRPDLPGPFLDVVDRATAASPDQRYRTAGELEAALAEALRRSQRRPVPWWTTLLGTAIAGALAAAVYFWPTRTGPAVEPVADVRSAPSASPAVAPGTYRVDAAVFRRQGTTDVRLAAGARIAPGDELSLRISASVPVYAYVVNEDDRGASFLLFPLPDQALKNPLPAGVRHEIPGSVNGEAIRWQVSTAGGREHFLIFVTPEPPTPAFERMFATLPRPVLGAPVLAQPLSAEHTVALRGVGGLTKSAATSSGPKLSDAFAVPLGEVEEAARGVWVRQLTLENPGK